jgi:photosystem II stability/assembly factor-like uncharacterized protein
MRKAYLLCFAILIIVIKNGLSDPVSISLAERIAFNWYKHICDEKTDDFSIATAWQGEYHGESTYYVFAFNAGGFVIVAADDVSIPILGYSSESPCSKTSMSPAAKDWLDEYSRQILEIRSSGIKNESTRQLWDAILSGDLQSRSGDIGPFLDNKWGQGCYYNTMCPPHLSGPCGHRGVGCVATSMSQVMHYHEHPPRGIGSHSYYHDDYGMLSADFGSTTYDWASMPKQVLAENEAVATLCYQAGVSVDMQYGYPDDNSGTYSELVPYALVNYFNYNPALEDYYLDDFDDMEDWKALLRADLDKQLPVLYSGSPKNGSGHAFVCDGYNMEHDKFHFNWGWNGYYNGWFAIGSLNPWLENYNYNNYAIFGIRPYNSQLVVRIVDPDENALFCDKSGMEIKVEVPVGNPTLVKLLIDGKEVASGTSTTLQYDWSTSTGDCGTHELVAWAIEGNDSVFHKRNVNVSHDWIEESTGFDKPMRYLFSLSAVDNNVVWSVPMDGVLNWYASMNEFTRTTDGGETWIAGKVTGCEEMFCGAIFGISEVKAYIPMFRGNEANPSGIYVTEDGGSTWNRQSSALFDNESSNPYNVYFFNNNDGWCMGDPIADQGQLVFEMYTTTDGGDNWTRVAKKNMPVTFPGEEGGFSSAVNDTIWFGTNKGRIYKSVDKGNSWNVSAIEGMEDQYIEPVFRNGSHGLANNFQFNNKPPRIFESFDGGETWNEFIPEGPMYCTDLVYVPGTENTWVSSGGHSLRWESGLSFSTDGGHSWSDFNGTHGTRFWSMVWLNDHCGWAGGSNRSEDEGGVYKFIGDISDIVAGTEEVFMTEKEVRVYPNPASTKAVIRFNLSEKQGVVLKLYDIVGKEIKAITSREYNRGDHNLQVDRGALRNGIYIYVLKVGDEQFTGKIIFNN